MKAKQKKKFGIGRVLALCFLALVIAAAAFLVIRFVPFGTYDLLPEGEGTVLEGGLFSYALPLDRRAERTA